MSNSQKSQKAVTILGDGCAALSLAARAVELPHHKLSIISTKSVAAKDHIWGFWAMPWLALAEATARKKWSKWAIVSKDHTIIHHSKKYPYCAIHRHKWLERCRASAIAAGVRFEQNFDIKVSSQQILDSRPPSVPDGMMLQHFVGWEVTMPAGSFDNSTAILMDFRCDQSRGMHFIYCLPFSDQRALIESTLFSPELAPTSFYEDAIKTYLETECGSKTYDLIRQETGVIPLGVMGRHDPAFVGIGANGGAIRPSSGYAFSFIQKQIDHAVKLASAQKSLRVKRPHSVFELWMDRIFLAVLRKYPELAPVIFTRMAAALTADEFALFLSGVAGTKLWLKVIIAMPKRPFIWGLFHPESQLSV